MATVIGFGLFGADFLGRLGRLIGSRFEKAS